MEKTLADPNLAEESGEGVRLSQMLLEAFQPIQAEEEWKLMDGQEKLFAEWKRKRNQLIEGQVGNGKRKLKS